MPCWHDISPRASVIYDLFGNGRTAVKVSVGRYMAENILNTADANNPLVRVQPDDQPRVDGRGPATSSPIAT